ncbi:hypothetical protein HDU76_006770 [Blyttiomyces sp. JEL0837]|nr:hypothetical protein HDU76_006770 [Blyttiomyces sp. JEL0837]
MTPSNLPTTTSTGSLAASIPQDSQDDFDNSIMDTDVERPFPRSSITKSTSYLRPAVVPLAPGTTSSPTVAAPIRPSFQRPARRPPTCKHPKCPKKGTGEKCPGSHGGITKCLANSLQPSTLRPIGSSTLPAIAHSAVPPSTPSALPAKAPSTLPAIAPSTLPAIAPSIPSGVVLRVSQTVNLSEQFGIVWEEFNGRMVGFYGVSDAITWREESERHLVEARQGMVRFPNTMFCQWVAKLERAKARLQFRL